MSAMSTLDSGSLRKHVDNLLRMEGAHIAFDQAVADFPAAWRGAKPAGVPHSAWELLEHMRLAQEDILDFSRNPEYRDKTFPDDYWPPAEAPPDQESWDRAVRQFQRDLTKMQALVADPANDLFTKFPHGQGQTLLREALLVADHNAYHLGQLVFLRKMLEAQAARR
jgi:DinB family protein